jgi:hypothetical protein
MANKVQFSILAPQRRLDPGEQQYPAKIAAVLTMNGIALKSFVTSEALP